MTSWLWALGGAVLGGLLADVRGVLGGFALGWLCGRQQILQRELRALSARLETLAGGTPAAADAEVPIPADTPPAASPRPVSMPGETTTASTAATAPAVDPWAPSPRAGTPATVWDDGPPGRLEIAFAPVQAAGARAWARLVAFFTTGNVIAKIGVVVLFIGVAFLVRLATERGLVPIELRLAAIALGGLALVAVGWHLRGRRREWALVVQGGGVGVLYLTVFAAARLYALVPLGFAFALLVVLVAATAALAVLQNAQALAALGVTGGFLAPVLTASGAGSHVALFSYYALLNAGILGIAWFRAWRVLNLLGFAFTWVIGAVWGARYYEARYFASVEPFVALSFLFYLAIPVLYASRQPPALRGLVDGTLVFGNPLFFFTIQQRLVDELVFGRAYAALATAGVYLILARALWRHAAAGLGLLAEAFLALAVLFLTLAIPFAVDGHWTAAAWALEGAGVVWVGLRQRRYLAQVAGLVLELGAATMFFLQAPLRLGPAAPLDQTALGAALIALAGGFTAYQLGRDAARAWRPLPPLAPWLLAWAVLWWGGALVIEIDRLLGPRAFLPAFAAATMISALVLAAVAQRLAWRLGHAPPALASTLGGLAGLAQWLGHIHRAPWRDGGWLAWPLVLAGGYVLLARYAGQWSTRVIDVLHTAQIALLVFFLTWGAAHGIGQGAALGGAWVLAGCGVVSVGLLAVLTATAGTRAWPWRQSPTAHRWAAPVLLLAMLAVWLPANLAHPGNAAPLAYLPLVNPLDLVALGALLAALAWWRRVAREQVVSATPMVLALFALAAFVVLNTGILRAMHHLADVPYTARALWRAPAVQAALALAWAVVGSVVMAAAARRTRARRHWMAGAALLGVVVVKLFLIDLAGSGAVARIVSFIGVGLVCLAIGYFAPIPPRAPGAARAAPA